MNKPSIIRAPRCFGDVAFARSTIELHFISKEISTGYVVIVEDVEEGESIRRT